MLSLCQDIQFNTGYKHPELDPEELDPEELDPEEAPQLRNVSIWLPEYMFQQQAIQTESFQITKSILTAPGNQTVPSYLDP